jgi:hypothetical protein
MKRNWLRSSLCAALSIVLVTVTVAGCAGPMQGSGSFFDDKKKAALICGAGGAAAGAAVGAAVGGSGRHGSLAGALIGAGIGAVAGAIVGATACFAIAEYRSQQVKGYDETRQAFNYQPSQGEVVQITRYEITPAAAAPGTQVSFNATYYVMTPSADREVPVTETRIVKILDPATGGYKELGRSVNEVTVKPGTRQADGKWEIRSGVAQGRYLVLFEVAKAERSDVKELPLIVTKDQAVLAAPANRVAQVVAEGTKATETAAVETPKAAPAAEPVTPAAGTPSATAEAAKTTEPTPATGAPPAGTPLAALGEQQPKAPPVATVSTTATPPPAPSAPPMKSVYFVASKVVGRGNVREGPGTKHKIIGEIQPAERFLVVDRATNPGERSPWYKIRLEDGREGWVAGSLGEEVEE